LLQYLIYWDFNSPGTTNLTLFTQTGVVVSTQQLFTQSSNLVTGSTYQFYIIA